MTWLEPLVEIERDGVRHAFGPVTPEDVPALLDGTLSRPRPGRGDPLLRPPDPADLSRCGVIDPLSLANTRRMAGSRACASALGKTPPPSSRDDRQRLARARRGGLSHRHQVAHGRRGQSEQKYIVCNADEGDSAAPSPTG
jgi:formate dehydrogenase iron-sulfur subunit